MTVAIVYSRALAGVHAPLVTVDEHLIRSPVSANLVQLRSLFVSAVEQLPRRRFALFAANCYNSLQM